MPKDPVALTLVAASLAACSSLPALESASPQSVPSAAQTAPTPASTIPPIPAPVAVTVNARSSALLVLDINNAVCSRYPACTATVPAVASLIQKARAAKVPVLYSTTGTPASPSPILAGVAPQRGEPVVPARADKFIDTNLEDLLKQRKASTLVMVGTSANGAVLYSAFHANARGFTVVVAEDAIASAVPIETVLARYQLLHQPGFTNAANKPLAERMVTLSRTDLITFK